MSAGLCTIVDAPTIQKQLRDTFNARNMRVETLPFLSYVNSLANIAASSVPILTNPSKKQPVQVIFDQPFLTSEVGTNGTGCIATDAPCDCTQTYDFDPTQNIFKSFTITPLELTDTLEENCAFIARKTQKMMNVLLEKISEDMATSVAGQLGAWSADTGGIPGVNIAANVLQLNTTLINGAGSAARSNPVLFEQLNQALTISRFEDSGVFGGLDLTSYLRQSSAGVGGDSQFSQAQMLGKFGVAIQYDRHLAAALTSALGAGNSNLAVGLGAIVPLNFSLYDAACNQLSGDTDIASTMVDPQTGVKFEFRMHKECDDWHVILRVRMDWLTWPDELYKVGSNYRGVKSLAAIGTTCTDLTPCPAA